MHHYRYTTGSSSTQMLIQGPWLITCAKFETFASGEINECYERCALHNRNQQQHELFEQFLTSISVLVKSGNFCDASRSSTWCDRIFLGVIDRDVQEALLKERNISLERTIVQSRRTCQVTEQGHSPRRGQQNGQVKKCRAQK